MWLFRKEELNEKRRDANIKARKGDVFIDDQEQLILLQFYTLKIKDYSKFFKFSAKVQLTAILLFKRFYIEQSAMEFDPKLILIACLFMSTKIEHEPIVLQEFLDKIPKGPKKHEMLDLELTLSSHVHFDYLIHHPTWALHGFFLDLQSFHNTQELYKSYQEAVDVCMNLYFTDCPLLYTGSQIALASLYLMKPGIMDEYIQKRFPEQAVGLKVVIKDIIEMTKLSITVDKEVAKEIAIKCQICLDSREKRPESPSSDVEGSGENNNPFQ